jgi:hypothetical protein
VLPDIFHLVVSFERNMSCPIEANFLGESNQTEAAPLACSRRQCPVENLQACAEHSHTAVN